MLPSALSRTDEFETRFAERLLELLELPAGRDAFGLFILVLANAGTMPGLTQRLGPALRQAGRRLASLPPERMQEAPPDDLVVFRKLQDIDPGHPPQVEQRSAGPWQLQLNPLRRLRPARNSNAAIRELHRPFDERGFHFDKPFLEREILWRGDLDGLELRLLFNKFPFARYHCLALINAAEHRPQFLEQQHLEQLLQVMDALSGLDGLAFAWNSLGAQASVNHQHWQMTLCDTPYPVESASWRHNGGDRDYPLPVFSFDSVGELWAAIDDCQRQNRAFNLFLRPGQYRLIRRRLQGDYAVPEWSGGMAWSEVCGAFSLGDEGVFRGLGERDIDRLLRALMP